MDATRYLESDQHEPERGTEKKAAAAGAGAFGVGVRKMGTEGLRD